MTLPSHSKHDPRDRRTSRRTFRRTFQTRPDVYPVNGVNDPGGGKNLFHNYIFIIVNLSQFKINSSVFFFLGFPFNGMTASVSRSCQPSGGRSRGLVLRCQKSRRMLRTHGKANLASSSSRVDRCWSSCLSVYECVCLRAHVEEPVSDQDTAEGSKVEGLEKKTTEISRLDNHDPKL